MEAKQELAEVPSRSVSSRLGSNIRAMQVRIQSRLRIAMTSRRLRPKSRRPGLVSVPGSPALRATATGFGTVARVFQGNVIFARMVRNMAKQEWQKRVGWVSSFQPSSISSRFWSWLGYSAAGGTLVAVGQPHQSPVLAEALVVAPSVEVVAAQRKAKQAKNTYYEGT